MNKRGISQLIAGILLVVFIVTIAVIIFSFVSKTATQETSKSVDKALALDICRENVKIRVNSVDPGEDLKIDLENLREQDITDFVIRLEKGKQVDITKKGGQTLGGYEKITLTGIENKFGTGLEVVKVIPQITLQRPELTSMSEGWWLCSDQMGVYKLWKRE